MTIDVRDKREVEKLLKEQLSLQENIEKIASINWDGKNFLIRIPKEIAWASGLNEENVFKKEIKFQVIIDKTSKIINKSFDIIDRNRPKREVKKHDRKKTPNKK